MYGKASNNASWGAIVFGERVEGGNVFNHEVFAISSRHASACNMLECTEPVTISRAAILQLLGSCMACENLANSHVLTGYAACRPSTHTERNHQSAAARAATAHFQQSAAVCPAL